VLSAFIIKRQWKNLFKNIFLFQLILKLIKQQLSAPTITEAPSFVSGFDLTIYGSGVIVEIV